MESIEQKELARARAELTRAKAEATAAETVHKFLAIQLRAVPGVGSGPIGLTPDSVKFSPEFKAARAAERAAWMAMQRANIAHNRARKALRNAERAAGVPDPRQPTTHCQICGRAIQSARGKIAHHGYKRPGQGWQTVSCFGARWRPYEVARDAIPHAIAAAEAYAKDCESNLYRYEWQPPAALTEPPRASGRAPRIGRRPEGFDVHNRPASYSTHSEAGLYAYLFWTQVDSIRDGMRHALSDAAALAARFRDWAPAPVKESASR